MSGKHPAIAIQPGVDAQRPWPGLLSFGEADRAFFFGREEEAQELLELVRNHRLTVLFGTSGLGKSSLLRAGLFPRLRMHDFLPVVLRLEFTAGSQSSSSQIKSALLDAVRESRADAHELSPNESVWEYLHRPEAEIWSARHRLLTPVFVFDQFEELFSRVPRDAAGDKLRASVVETIADLSEGQVPRTLKSTLERDPELAEKYSFREHQYRLVVTIREDYLPDLDDLASEILSLGRSRMRLNHMRGTTAMQAVSAAGKPAGIVASDLPLKIVRFVGASSASAPGADISIANLSIDPALLSVLCFELNEERIRDKKLQITPDQLDNSDEILSRFYAKAVEGSPDALLRFLEEGLITAEGIREMVAYERLLQLPDVSAENIATLINGRVLRVEYREGRRRVELTHDLLARIVRKRRDQRRHLEQTKSTVTPAADGSLNDIRQMAGLLEGLRALGSSRVLDEVLALVLDAAIDVTGVERAFIMLAEADGGLEIKMARARGRVTLMGSRFETSRRIPDETFRTGQSQFVADVLDDARFDYHRSHEITMGIRSIICIPLRVVRYVDRADGAVDRIIGVLYLDDREKKAFDSTSLQGAVETLATEAAVAIENARLYRESFEKIRIEQELRIAAEIQRSLLPPGQHQGKFYAAMATSQPSRNIGGDFFDFSSRIDGSFGFVLGDVSGRGTAAALLVAQVQALHGVSADVGTPTEIITTINRGLTRVAVDARFATLFEGTLTPAGVLSYCNAGHNLPVLISGESVVRLEAGGMPVGLIADAQYEEATVQLTEGDLLVVFSDGVSEALNAGGEEFGEQRIIDAVLSAERRQPEQVVHVLTEAIADFVSGAPQHDDLTLMAVQYTGR